MINARHFYGAHLQPSSRGSNKNISEDEGHPSTQNYEGQLKSS